LNLNEKKELVQEVKSKFEASQGFFITRNLGLNAAEIANLRKDLRGAKGEFKVIKNTLTRIVVKDLGYNGVDKDLNGPTAVAFSVGDPAAIAKALIKISKDTNNKLEIASGYLGKTLLSAKDVEALSSLPSKKELVQLAVSTIAAPLQNFMGVLSAVPRDFMNVLTAIKDKKEN
jgi:large subunit ribosomal protein L10